MRIISGKNKGVHLKAVPGTGTRPTTDKVKEAIFNMIGPYFEGGKALDLFAGSGGLGLEGLSRGLDSVIFVDKDRMAVQTIKHNIEKCGYQDRSEVYRNDAERALKAVSKRDIAFECIFLDPPYKKQQLEKLLEWIIRDDLLADSGVVMCEHDEKVMLPEEIGNLILTRQEQYGGTVISIFKKKSNSGEGEHDET
ncbi:16S rRNA (guanine(966)-N(2))-methyltransferase RsmD [Jeotgalibacillus sp. R-1-5s-1]|uniref:16S rRNA (guanine(966)-N(2))-methyltransferase RsmD n=1 Tax=Jeotgalibacillus sp. R-1-5s-1 TaxID=2555897 RepID=UPI0010695B69|nr:16S rRNA (guanine(966)-N(2))-methyltransferase RsmD [Jeotgalibacillus sp. R-1-5s-1]TFE03598.1 16S rRNA (guanine(966)-N(2))-methyltransferase RsmD [Jeotgalibacillus sp. R-1-5s-1]